MLKKKIAGLVSILFLILCQPLILHAEKAGWPVAVNDDVYSSPALADIDGDGKLEVIVGVTGGKKEAGILYAWRYDGTVYPGWPQTLAGRIQFSNPAVGNLDQKSEGMEIVSCTTKGNVYVFHKDGTVMAGWPKTLPGIGNSLVIADLNGDGKLDIIVGCADKKVYAYTGSGESIPGWPQDTGAPVGKIIVRNINGYGKTEVLASSGQKIYMWDAKGQPIPGWPKEIAGFAEIGDLDPKYKGLEIVCVGSDKINVLHSDGTAVTGWPQALPGPGSPAIGDINEDGLLEVAVSSQEKDSSPRMYAFRANGSIVSGWPVGLSIAKGYGVGGAPVLVDLDGDGKMEIVVGSSCYSIHAWYSDGSMVQNFPIQNIGMQFSSPAIADLDDNGRMEIVFGDVSSVLKVHVFEIPFYYR